MFLSQIALNFDLKILMFELLDPKGSVFDVIYSNMFKFNTDEISFGNLKYEMFNYKMILIGIYDNIKNKTIINSNCEVKIKLKENISFIVIRNQIDN